MSRTPLGKVKIGFFSMEEESSYTIGGDDDSWVPGDSMAEALERYRFAVPGCTHRTPIRASGSNAFLLEREDGRIRRYIKLTPPPPSPAATAPPGGESSSSPAEEEEGGGHPSFSGLSCAPYGSHGLEIVQLSTEISSSPSRGPASEEAAAAAAAAAEAEAAAGVSKCSSFASRTVWSGRRGGSCSGASTGRMTDGSESVCTSAPATEDGDGSEDEAEAGDGAGGAGGSGWGGADAANDGDGAAESPATDDSSATPRRSKNKGGVNHRPGGRRAADGQGSAVASAAAAAMAAAASEANSPSHLFGFKVTGDENVPAGKTSFVIDLKTEFDIDFELQADSRPVVMFLPTGAVMANLANRREQISTWRKGRGQINRVPGRWLPEWVDVDFVAYRPGARCAFSVIFRQPTQAVRVVMDFERALGCEEGWPQWPTAPEGPGLAGDGVR